MEFQDLSGKSLSAVANAPVALPPQKKFQDDSQPLKPGSKIKPVVTCEEIERIVQRLYGITAQDVSELVSYDDRNFLIHTDRNIKNPLIVHQSPNGYILKVLNALDSQKRGFLDAQTEMLLYLGRHEINCPKPIKNVFGKYFAIEKINDEEHAVRLLEFMPGKTFSNVTPTHNLIYQIGEFLAKFDCSLKGFNHEALLTHKTLWMLESVPQLTDFLYVVKDTVKKSIFEQAIARFDREVLNGDAKLTKAIIHGDFNEQNIIVAKVDGSDANEYRVAGILDFGDICQSHLIFELAIAMTYAMLQTKNLASGGLVIAGYESVRLIPDTEWQVLKCCVAARLCQSLVLGSYTHSLDPSNDYLLTTQESGWSLLKDLCAQPDGAVEELWRNTANAYLTQSTK